MSETAISASSAASSAPGTAPVSAASESRASVWSQPSRIGMLTAIACTLLSVLFGTMSYRAALGKSATFDEPLHVVGGFIHRYFHDYRINPEDPALFGMWAAIPLRQTILLTDITSPKFQLAASDVREQWPFVIGSMFQTRNSEGEIALNSARAMFTLLGSVLVLMTAWWTWRLCSGTWKGGALGAAIGAVVSALLLSFDPNFLAHASIVKNDVPLALLMCGAAYTVWQFGHRGSWWRLIVLSLLVGAAVNVKFSGLLLGPIVALMLLVRAMMPFSLSARAEDGTWRVFGIDFTTRLHRALAVVGVLFVIAMMTWATTWAVYGFRFAATRDGTPINFESMHREANIKGMIADELSRGRPGAYSDQQLVAYHEIMTKFRSGAVTQVPAISAMVAAGIERNTADRMVQTSNTMPGLIEWARKHKLLPEAWLFGLLYTYATTLLRSSYLLGESRVHGWWYYFPLAMLFKTPVATMLAALGALIVAVATALTRLSINPSGDTAYADAPAQTAPRTVSPTFDWWSLACVAVPPLVYMLAALTTNLNLGLRHVLPVYPFVFIGIGVVAARLSRVSLSFTSIMVGALVFVLMMESIAASPNYLAYFNFVAGGTKGGMTKLGDSNLDWGQDLKQLAEWQQTHRDRPLFAAYFGSADPKFYGVDSGNITPRFPFTPVVQVPAQPIYLAISATELQHIYSQNDDYGLLRDKAKPIAILGGTIYVYEWPQPGMVNRAEQR